MAIGIQAGLHRDDVSARVRDERGMCLREERAIAGEKVQQMRHLLQVGRDVRIVAVEVDVIELQINDVLHAARRLAKLAAWLRLRCRRLRSGRTDQADCQP